jgi:hypothetical protein
VESRALEAVFVYLVRQDFAAGVMKAELGEEVGNAREQADALYFVMLGFIQ